MQAGQDRRPSHPDPEELPGLREPPKVAQAQGLPDRDLQLLEEVEGQVQHRGAQAEADRGKGGCNHTEILQNMAGKKKK